VKKSSETIGQRIARLRGKLSQLAFAERAGISRRTLQNIESGETASPGIDNIVDIARALEVPVGDVIGEEKPLPREKIIQMIESSSSEDVLRIAGLILEQFAASPPRLRAVVLAYLFQDFEIMRKYKSDLPGLLPKPK
jgi:transcriptional regulator with XRE-family HTH domain